MSSDVGYGSPPAEHRFRPGRSGNPGGRPKGLARKVREVVGDDGDALVGLWSAVLDGYIVSRHPQTGDEVYKEVSVADRLAVSRLLADRGWGKAPQHMPIEADDPLEHGLDIQGAAEDFNRLMDELKEKRRRWAEEHARRDGDAARD